MKKRIMSCIIMAAMMFVAILTATISSSAQDVTALRVNTSVKDAGKEREAIVYKVTLPAAGRLNVNMKHINLYDTKTYWTIEVLANDLETVLQTTNSTGVDTNLTCSTLGLDKGTYYIRVWAKKDCSDEFSDATYTLKAKFKKSSAWEIEYNQKTKKTNNSQAASRLIRANKPAYGVIDSSDDVDFFKVRITKKGYVKLSLKHKNILESENTWQAQLVNAKTKVITTVVSSGTRTSISSPLIGVTPGVYYIRVSGATENYSTNYNTSDYTVMLSFKASNGWEAEYNSSTGRFNDRLSTANTIKTGRAVTATLASEDDIDCFKVRIGSTKRVSFILRHKYKATRKSYYVVSVFNSSLQKVTTFRSYGVDSKAVSSVRLRKGTYFVKVSKADVYTKDNYTLTVK